MRFTIPNKEYLFLLISTFLVSLFITVTALVLYKSYNSHLREKEKSKINIYEEADNTVCNKAQNTTYLRPKVNPNLSNISNDPKNKLTKVKVERSLNDGNEYIENISNENLVPEDQKVKANDLILNKEIGAGCGRVRSNYDMSKSKTENNDISKKKHLTVDEPNIERVNTLKTCFKIDREEILSKESNPALKNNIFRVQCAEKDLLSALDTKKAKTMTNTAHLTYKVPIIAEEQTIKFDFTITEIPKMAKDTLLVASPNNNADPNKAQIVNTKDDRIVTKVHNDAENPAESSRTFKARNLIKTRDNPLTKKPNLVNEITKSNESKPTTDFKSADKSKKNLNIDDEKKNEEDENKKRSQTSGILNVNKRPSKKEQKRIFENFEIDNDIVNKFEDYESRKIVHLLGQIYAKCIYYMRSNTILLSPIDESKLNLDSIISSLEDVSKNKQEDENIHLVSSSECIPILSFLNTINLHETIMFNDIGDQYNINFCVFKKIKPDKKYTFKALKIFINDEKSIFISIIFDHKKQICGYIDARNTQRWNNYFRKQK